jgi:hypothetical protein
MIIPRKSHFEQVPIALALKVAQQEAQSKQNTVRRRPKARREFQMSRFDVFELLTDGQVLWHQAMANLAEAHRLAEEKARVTRNSFFVFDQVSREKIFVDPASSSLRTQQGIQTKEYSSAK